MRNTEALVTPAKTQEKITDFKLPKTLAECADLMYKTRHERYALNAQAARLEKIEGVLRDHLINTLPKSNATGVSGKLANVRIEVKEVVSVTDWSAVYAHISKTQKKDPGVWSLLQRRIGDSTVKEMWALGKTMPGCSKLEVKTVSLTKL